MELDVYLRTLVRRWYIPVVLLALAVLGVWTYHSATVTSKATATVTVLQSFLPTPGEFVAPQIGFDALDESGQLNERVAEKLDDGTAADDLNISVHIVSNFTSPSPSLVYGVTAEASDDERAILVANVAVEEARTLFAEINTPNARDVRAAFQPEIDRAQGEVDLARDDRDQFEFQNNAYDLEDRVDQQLDIISQLRITRVNLELGEAGSTSLDGGASIAVVRLELEAALAEEDAELQRLLALEPEYERLNLILQKTEGRLAELERRVVDTVVGRTLPAEAQVKLLDDAEIRTDVFFTLITYALAVTLAIFLAISIIYFFALYERVAPSPQELEAIFGQSVTTQVPGRRA
jgi:hypothetical protein